MMDVAQVKKKINEQKIVPMKTVMLKPYANNSNTHSDWQVKQIAESIKEFGFTNPVLVDNDGQIIAGHGRVLAAHQIGLDTVPTVSLGHLTQDQRRAYIIADNQLARLAQWDHETLAAEIVELQKFDYDIGVLGFDDKELANIQKLVPDAGWPGQTESNTDPDDVPEVEENIHKVERGQIWQLGEHRLMCGNSTSKDDVEKLMAGEKADMVFTDPPYGMFLEADFSKGMTLKGGKPMAGKHSKMGHKGHKHENVKGDHADFDPKFIEMALSVEAKETFLWGADYYAELLPERNRGSWIIWDKRVRADGEAIKQAMTTSEFETCWSKQKHQRLVCRMVHSGICSIENDKRVHPTQKPVALAEWFFDRWGKGLTNVVDLFLGSGSTLIACEKTNRKCYGMEISEHYVSVVIERWERYTGKKAVKL